MSPVNDGIFELEKALLSLDKKAAEKVTRRWLEMLSPFQFTEQIMTPALEKMGMGWERGTIALSQIYLSAKICEELLNNIIPKFDDTRQKDIGVSIGILEDQHLLGKRIVSSIIRAAGYRINDLGHGLSAENLVKAAIESNTRILLISVLMLPSALRVTQVMKLLEEAGSDMKVAVGGAPFVFDRNLWHRVGAHISGVTASDALAIIKRLSGEHNL